MYVNFPLAEPQSSESLFPQRLILCPTCDGFTACRVALPGPVLTVLPKQNHRHCTLGPRWRVGLGASDKTLGHTRKCAPSLQVAVLAGCDPFLHLITEFYHGKSKQEGSLGAKIYVLQAVTICKSHGIPAFNNLRQCHSCRVHSVLFSIAQP